MIYGVLTIHLAAVYRLDTACQNLIVDGSHSDPKDDYGRTPLFFTAREGHAIVLKVLLNQVDDTLNSINGDGRTPLYIAIEYGHEEVVTHLLDRMDVAANLADKYCQTPLFMAM